MEIICIDKRTFDELVVRFSMIEKKVTGICNPAKDAGLRYAGFSAYQRERFRYIVRKGCCLSPGSRTSSSTSRKMCKTCWNQVITHKKESHELRSYRQKGPAD